MNETSDVIIVEDRCQPPFFKKIPVVVTHGQGVYFWDEQGKRYLDFTSGWGVTCLGHGSPIITRALIEQSQKIIQNPNSGLTYSPARARLLALFGEILPANLTRVFFGSSGAEVNDAVIKLARKVTGRFTIIASRKGFHGRTITTSSATGQTMNREKCNPVMPHNVFVPYNDIPALKRTINSETAAVLLEPVQGEGGVNLPDPGYLEQASNLCAAHGACLIIDEVQTGFCRTGSMFAIDGQDIKPDFMTMAKGIAGGFPFAAFAMSERVASCLERGDHGGTYSGNPLGCAVAHAVISHLRAEEIHLNVRKVGETLLVRLKEIQAKNPKLVQAVRGKGLLVAIEFVSSGFASALFAEALKRGLMLNLIQERVIRIFPALNISLDEMEEGMAIFGEALLFCKSSGQREGPSGIC